MTGQVVEEVAPQIAGNADERGVRDPTGQSPKQVIRRDQRHHECEGGPYACPESIACQGIDEELDAVLGADRTADRGQHREEYGAMGNPAPTDEPEYERDGGVGVSTDITHCTHCR